MHYIVIDLEWNQPLSHQSSAFRRVGDRLMFEMIQIGAIKLDEHRRMRGSFSRLITPQFYMKLHPRIRRITGITQEDLADAPGFQEALKEFLEWCGDDAVLLTWGSDDISVFQQNLDFFKSKCSLPPFYDLQSLYCAVNEGGKDRKGLSAALNYYGIEASDEHPFHNAVDDAYYTALVYQRFPDATAIFNHPESARQLGKTRSGKRETGDEKLVKSERGYYASSFGKLIPCPVCGKKGRVMEGYVLQRGIRTALADCPDHGLMYVQVAFDTNEKQELIARRKIIISDEQNPAYVVTKHLQWQQKATAQRGR